MSREIVLDTETTGLYPKEGHKLVEIGCVELHNYLPTGKIYHTYINPERDMPKEAFEVHGLSSDFLSKKPIFKLVAKEFLDFIDDSTLVIHNATFDLKFINYELNNLGYNSVSNTKVVDTLKMARKKFPGSPASLDALCRRFQIDRSDRIKHGALIDADLLAKVYLELIGGKQPDLNFKDKKDVLPLEQKNKKFYTPRPHSASKEELEIHESFIKKIKNPIWLQKI